MHNSKDSMNVCLLTSNQPQNKNAFFGTFLFSSSLLPIGDKRGESTVRHYKTFASYKYYNPVFRNSNERSQRGAISIPF